MSQRYAPIRDPQFEGRPTIDGVPAATMQDLMELRNSWLDKLNDRVVELFFSNGNAAVSAPNSNPISNSSLSNRVAMYMGRVRTLYTPAGMGLLVGLPSGADFHYPGDPTVIPDVQIRTSGVFPTRVSYRFSSFLKDGKTYYGELNVDYYMLDKKTIAHTWENKYWLVPGVIHAVVPPLIDSLTGWLEWYTDDLPSFFVAGTETPAPIVVLTESGTYETQPEFAPTPLSIADSDIQDTLGIHHRVADYGLTYWCQAIREQS